ncbi:hypothetical protein R5R35_002579 [Gryllus longicercus]|uniref:Protein sleepless n=1 Tax=Gryllus longicercus TaxID=2509291 RepID=A0AAN9VRP4_9ORTH
MAIARSPPSPAALVLLAAAFSAGVRTAAAIDCYVCNSVTDAACADPFRSGSVEPVQCTPDAVQKSLSDTSKALSDVFTKFGVDIPTGTMELAFVCQKFEQTDKKGHEVVIRSCAFNPETVNACPPENSGAKCLQCNTDLCNGASRNPGTIGMNFLAILALPAMMVRLLRP